MGFSLTGLIMAFLLIIPNILYFIFPAKNKPQDINNNVSKLFLIIEKIGQIMCIIILIFSKDNFSLKGINVWNILYLVFVALYYGVWLRYVVNDGEYKYLYSPVFKIPFPMIITSFLALLFASIYGGSILLFIAVLIYGLGAYFNGYYHYKIIRNGENNND